MAISESLQPNERTAPLICGIDPGLQVTGYAVLRSGGTHPGACATIVDAGVCRVEPGQPLAERLLQLQSDLSAVFEEHRPSVVAVEKLYAHYKHPRTAILMGYARGVILVTAARLGIAVEDFAATQVKRYLTGNGRAGKPQVQRAIQITLGLASLPEPSDVADALAIGLCCCHDRLHRSSMEARG